MSVLVDTNVFARASQPSHPHHAAAVSALTVLTKKHPSLFVSSQNLYEYYAIATRPIEANGLGMTPQIAARRVDEIRTTCTVIFDSAAVLATWRKLVEDHAVSGKNAHDARLAATMLVHGIADVLTFNGAALFGSQT